MFDNAIRTAGVVAATLTLISCDTGAFLAPAEDGPNEINGVEVASITLDAASLIVEDDTVALHATVLDETGQPIDDPALELVWSSSDETVATVESTEGTEGELITRSPGTTTLTVSYDEVSTSTTIEVHNRPVDLVYVAGSGQQGAPGATLPDSLTVRAVDKRGDAVQGVHLTFSAVAGGGSVSRSAGTTDATGVLRTAWTLGSSGAQEVRALASEAQPRVKKMHDSVAVFTATVVDTTVTVSSVVVTPDSALVDTAGTVDLDADVRDNNGNAVSSGGVAWASSDTTVARVGHEGLVTAVGEGQVTISATCDSVTGTSAVTVAGSSEGTLVISASADTLYGIGDTLVLSVEARDADGTIIAYPDVQWSSSDPHIATVDSMGTVISRALGTVVIAASTVCCSGDFYDVTVESGSPGTVTDLQVVAVGTDSVSLHWTEVGDGTGSPADYAIRYGSPTISWGDAYETEVVVEGAAVGTTASHTYSGLASGTDYEFQLISYRGTLNVDAEFGSTSNVVAGSTDTGSDTTVVDTTTQDTQVASVTATPSDYTFTSIGQTTQISASAYNSSGSRLDSVEFVYTSTDSSIVTVDGTGVMTAQALGSALIVVSAACCTDVSDTTNSQVDTTASGSFFSDDFESYDIGTAVTGAGDNGFSWGGVHDAVYVSDELARTGTRSLKGEYGPTNPNTGEADHWWAEQNFNMGRDIDEVWIEFYIYHLDGNEGLGAQFYRTETQPTKMMTVYSADGDGYNNAFHTYEYWSIDGNPARIRANTNTGRHGGNIVFPSSELRGTWIQFRTHFQMASSPGAADGLSETWINGVLQESVTGIDWDPEGSSSRFFQLGYLFGYDNEHFPEATAIYIDDIEFYDTDPGW